MASRQVAVFVAGDIFASAVVVVVVGGVVVVVIVNVSVSVLKQLLGWVIKWRAQRAACYKIINARVLRKSSGHSSVST